MNATSGLRTLAELTAQDAPTVGGKAANLGELMRAHLPVPPGFVVSAAAYLAAMDEAGVRGELRDLHSDALGAARRHDTAGLTGTCERLGELVCKAGMPSGLAAEVRSAYGELGVDRPVAVRSSAVGEDGADASFAGMNATFTNVLDADALIAAVVNCWASAVTPPRGELPRRPGLPQ